MDTENRFQLITKFPTVEVLTEDDLRERLQTNQRLKHYIGFEISGHIHLGTGLGCMRKVADFQKANINTTLYLADWHTWINNKLDSDWERIDRVCNYFEEIMKLALKIQGGNPEKMKILKGTQLYHNNNDYWKSILEVSKNIRLKRALKSVSIMGRKEGEELDLAKLIYAPMQTADIFAQDLDIAHAGMDQRKVHVIAREVARKIRTNRIEREGEIVKPIAVHHDLWLGLTKPPVWPITNELLHRQLSAELKMSKSVANSSVFMTDSEKVIRKKIAKAFCPEKEIEYNPVLNWIKHIGFLEGKPYVIERPAKFGGDVEYINYQELASQYREGKIHPQDLKGSISSLLIKMLSPAREMVKRNPELLEDLPNLQY